MEEEIFSKRKPKSLRTAKNPRNGKSRRGYETNCMVCSKQRQKYKEIFTHKNRTSNKIIFNDFMKDECVYDYRKDKVKSSYQSLKIMKEAYNERFKLWG